MWFVIVITRPCKLKQIIVLVLKIISWNISDLKNILISNFMTFDAL